MFGTSGFNLGQGGWGGPVVCPPPKNRDGSLGPICRTCDGWGFLLGIKTSGSCGDCKGTGVVRSAFDDPMVLRYIAEQKSEIAAIKEHLKKYDIQNSRQYWTEQIWWATADGAAVHTTTTETILFPDVVIPANYMSDGRTLEIKSAGKLSTTGTPTIVFAIRWGGVAGTLLATSEAITMGSGVANVNWIFDATIQTRANGATGSLLVMGRLFIHTSATAVAVNVFSVSGYDAPAAVTGDLSIDKSLSVTADWSASSASNTIAGMVYSGTSMN